MFEAFCRDKLGPLVLRVALGLVCVYHGFLKIMAAGGTAWYPNWPVGWQLFVAWGEFGAGLAIVLGFYCRFAATLILVLTLGTLAWSQGRNLFDLSFKNLEPTFLLLLTGLALLFLGAGQLSVDARGGGKVFKKR